MKKQTNAQKTFNTIEVKAVCPECRVENSVYIPEQDDINNPTIVIGENAGLFVMICPSCGKESQPVMKEIVS